MAKKIGGTIPKVGGPRPKPFGGAHGAVQKTKIPTGTPASQGRPGSPMKVMTPMPKMGMRTSGRGK